MVAANVAMYSTALTTALPPLPTPPAAVPVERGHPHHQLPQPRGAHIRQGSWLRPDHLGEAWQCLRIQGVGLGQALWRNP